MGDSQESILMAVNIESGQEGMIVGVAYVDFSQRQLGACQFIDDPQFCTLEAVALQLGAKECVIPKVLEAGSSSFRTTMAHLHALLSRCGLAGVERPFPRSKNLMQDLTHLLKSGSLEQHKDALEGHLAETSLAAVLAYSELTADSSNFGRFSLLRYEPGKFLRLDSAALHALNVFPSSTDANENFSLYGLMNRSRTPMAKRLLKVWLKQPLVTLEDIVCRHDIVEAFVSDPQLREGLRNQQLRGMPDVGQLTRKLERKKTSLSDLCQLYRVSCLLPCIESTLRSYEGEHCELLHKRFADVIKEAHDDDSLVKFEELLEAAVDLDRIPDEYLISAEYDSGLQEVQAEKAKTERAINKAAARAAEDLSLVLDKTVKLDWLKSNNSRTRVLRITQKEEKIVRKTLQARYIVLETRKDGTKFSNKELQAAASRLQQLSSSYDKLQDSLVQQVVGVAHTFVEVWSSVASVLAEMDVLLGFADLAVTAPTPFVRPTMLPPDDSSLVLVGCRHPCVEAQEGVSFVKNDCKLVKGESWFQVITGPNMGGKSTYIRQVGVNVLMAQVGSFVPCDSATIAVRDCIFARVGAGDCQLAGVSTFMAEMLETAAILKGATSRSLVIIDELGRGTSTYDGFGLAWAISEHLMAKLGCPTLFATHFHELTRLQDPIGVANFHVDSAIDKATGKLTMLYQLAEGGCDQSFGIHVAEFAQFPQVVVELAKRKSLELEGFGQPTKRSRPDGELPNGDAMEVQHAICA